MTRVLVTGGAGFAGAHLVAACEAAGETVSAPGRAELDLRELAPVEAYVRHLGPEVVFHLAALSSVGRSWEDPARTLTENTATAVAVLEAIRRGAPEARVVWVSSCEVYGTPVTLPIAETAPPAPANPYAVSKAAGEMLAAVYAAAHRLRITIARPFSHSGPGQRSIFLMSSLARQAAQARVDERVSVEVVTGNPRTRRDFTDVRDVVRAYRKLAELPLETSEGGAAQVFNVASGSSISAGEQVELLTRLLDPIRVVHTVDPARVRAREVMDLRGDATRLRERTGWRPEIPLERTMADTIAFWEHHLRAA